jgi:hypothetical protein
MFRARPRHKPAEARPSPLPFPDGFLISQKFNDQIWVQKVGAHRIRHIFLSKSKAIFLILKYVIRPVGLEWKFDPDCLFTFFVIGL